MDCDIQYISKNAIIQLHNKLVGVNDDYKRPSLTKRQIQHFEIAAQTIYWRNLYGTKYQGNLNLIQLSIQMGSSFGSICIVNTEMYFPNETGNTSWPTSATFRQNCITFYHHISATIHASSMSVIVAIKKVTLFNSNILLL